MRTSRLSRWVISGALVAAGVVAGFGGQATACDTGPQTPAVESTQVDTPAEQADTSTQSVDNDGNPANDGYEWT